jgi:hypothetical protein
MPPDELPRLADGLEGFELWDRSTRAPEHREVKTAFVSIRVGGTIGVNTTAYAMWGEPEACRVMFDPERRRLGLKPVSSDDPQGYEMHRCSQVAISCKKLFEYYGVEIVETRRYYDPKIVDGVLVVDL